jgi:hypothetical protein
MGKLTKEIKQNSSILKYGGIKLALPIMLVWHALISNVGQENLLGAKMNTK